jgi:L-alanine-DL-glutamate epimerase-like enolase superfamily enzyme
MPKKRISMALHWAGSPVSLMAMSHCAAATQNFIALEHHHVDDAGFEIWQPGSQAYSGQWIYKGA